MEDSRLQWGSIGRQEVQGGSWIFWWRWWHQNTFHYYGCFECHLKQLPKQQVIQQGIQQVQLENGVFHGTSTGKVGDIDCFGILKAMVLLQNMIIFIIKIIIIVHMDGLYNKTNAIIIFFMARALEVLMVAVVACSIQVH